MKVTLEEHYKDLYTLADLERAKAIIKFEKSTDEKPEDWLEYAVSEALRDSNDGFVETLKAIAHTSRNYRVMDAYFDGSYDMDVWVEGIAKTYDGFIEVGAYLSDIWQTGADFYYRDRMWVRHYTHHD